MLRIPLKEAFVANGHLPLLEGREEWVWPVPPPSHSSLPALLGEQDSETQLNNGAGMWPVWGQPAGWRLRELEGCGKVSFPWLQGYCQAGLCSQIFSFQEKLDKGNFIWNLIFNVSVCLKKKNTARQTKHLLRVNSTHRLAECDPWSLNNSELW